MKRFVVITVLLVLTCGYAYAQNYDPFGFRPGVSIYQPPPVTGGVGWSYSPDGGFTYIYDRGGYGGVTGINIPNRGFVFPPGTNPFDD